MAADLRCNCMVLFDPVLPPGEHHHTCPLSKGTLQYRVHFDEKPQAFWDDPDNDGLWDADRSLVEEEADIHRELGATNVRIVKRIVLPEPVALKPTQGDGDA
jgi:hypothetical protein